MSGFFSFFKSSNSSTTSATTSDDDNNRHQELENAHKTVSDPETTNLLGQVQEEDEELSEDLFVDIQSARSSPPSTLSFSSAPEMISLEEDEAR